MRRKTKLGIAAAVLALPLLGMVTVVGLNSCQRGVAGATPNLAEGRLADCPSSPNCVCSMGPGGESHYIEPLKLTGTPEETMARLAAVIEAMPRTKILTQREDYIYATFTTALMRYTDDVEFLLDREAGVVQVRSASRVGYSDLGTNRKRVERIRKSMGE